MLEAFEGETVLRVGSMSYYPCRALLVGPNGEIGITAQASRVAERLFRRPGVTIETGVLVDAMYHDPASKPASADVVLRLRIKLLRTAITTAGGDDDVRIRHDRRLGYVVEVVKSGR